MRQLILQQNPDKNGSVTVIGKDYRYLRQVLRVRVGDMLSLRCPDGQLYNSTVVKIEENTKKIFLQICADTNLSDELSKFLEGFKMIYTHLVEVLKKFEVTEIECLNKPFDHNFEQALMTTKVDGVESGMVVEVLQKGYLLKDKVIRTAMVKVSE